MLELLFIFFAALFLNVVWEVAHCRLYTTCLEMEDTALATLLVWQSVKDAFWITLAYLFLMPNILAFAGVLLLFSYVTERHAIVAKRWEYAPSMPLVLGVGLTPLLELAVTGLLVVGAATLLGM